MTKKTLTEIKYNQHFKDQSFISFWVHSIFKTNSLLKLIVISIISIVIGVAISFREDVSRLELIQTISDIALTYSITILGFMLVSLTLLLTNSDPKESFSNFTDDENEYQMPFVKIITMHFLFPIVFIAVLFLLSVGSKILVFLLAPFIFESLHKILMMCIFTSFMSFFLLFSLIEIIYNYWNIYRFMVVVIRNQSQGFEEEIIERYIINQKEPKLTEQETVLKISKNLEQQNDE